jgi:hypothetical protein
MIFLNQKFEYYVLDVPIPSNAEWMKLDFNSKEYRVKKWHMTYAKLLLNEVGAKGWELINKSNNSYLDEKTRELKEVSMFIFKRSSWSKFYNTDLGVNLIAISDLANSKVEEEYKTLDILDNINR